MSTYSSIYLALAIIIILIAAFNRLDLLCVGAVCFVVYSIYCIPGKGKTGFYRPQLSWMLYAFIFLQMTIIIVFVAAKRIRERAEKRINIAQPLCSPECEEKEDRIATKAFSIYTIIMLAFVLINIVRAGIGTFVAGKLLVWERTDIFYLVSLYGAYPAFAYGIRYRKIWMAVSGLLIELTIFFAGSRAFLATMMIILLCEWGYRLWKQHKSCMGLYLIGAFAVVFLLMYRAIDVYIMQGNIKGALQVLSQSETWATAFEFNEPRVIIGNYDYVLTTHTMLPLPDVIYRIVDFIPGITKFIPFNLTFPEYFSTWLQDAVHGSQGVGGTIWGESYAMFGALGIPVATCLWLCFVAICNKHLEMPEKWSPFLLSVGVHLAWYINRLDYNRVGQVLKVMLLCFLLWAGIYLVLGGVLYTKNVRIEVNDRRVLHTDRSDLQKHG